MTRFRTRLFTAAGVAAVLFAMATLAAMQTADSQPMGARGASASGATATCARASERWDDAGYYQTEYARQHCEPGVGAP
jgi:hypothetical protein